MPLDQIATYLLFSLVAAITPGPSNVMITATGAGRLFFLMAFPGGLVWLAGGSLLNRLLGDERSGRIVNIVMGLLLAASVVLVI